MAEENNETEVKFYIADIKAVKERLQTLGAHLIHKRTFELNLRFDTPAGDLIREGRVLRLRKDEAFRLTYKDRSKLKDGVLSRREIEFCVSNLDSARQFIEALGYEIIFIYEKYRTTYSITGITNDVARELQSLETHIMLDELPYGNFVEIEGELDELKPLAQKLLLNWDAAIPASYHSLFERISKLKNLAFRDLRFENFKSIKIGSVDLGVRPADI
jgi:adenylate cyclase, class 2